MMSQKQRGIEAKILIVFLLHFVIKLSYFCFICLVLSFASDNTKQDKSNKQLLIKWCYFGLPISKVAYCQDKSTRWPDQGILSAPGIAGYEWVPAIISCFFQNKIFYIIPMADQKQGKRVLICQPTLPLFSLDKCNKELLIFGLIALHRYL